MRALIAMGIALALPLAAQAGPCDTASDGMMTGALTTNIRDGGLMTPRRVCPRTSLGIGVDANAIIDLGNFYGNLGGHMVLDGSVAVLNNKLELFGTLEAVRYDSVIGAISASGLGLGYLTLGLTYTDQPTDDLAVGVRARTVLPTTTAIYSSVRPLGFDVAAASTWTGLPWLRLHDELGMATRFMLGRGATVAQIGFFANLGLEMLFTRSFGLVVDLDAGFNMDAPVDYLNGGLGFRFSDGKRFGAELGARIPVAGADRQLARFALRFDVRFGKMEDGARAVTRSAR